MFTILTNNAKNITNKKEYKDNCTDFIETEYVYQNGANLLSQTTKNVAYNDDGTENTENITVSNTYDYWANPVTQTDANGNTITYFYDSNNRLVKTVNPDGSEVKYRYRPSFTEVCDELGNKTITYHTRARQTDSIYYTCFGIWHNQLYYDAYGNKQAEEIYSQQTDTNGEQLVYSTVKYAYDTAQRPIKKEVYDKDNNLVYKETYSYTIADGCLKKTTSLWSSENTTLSELSEYFDVYGNKIKTQNGTDYENYCYDYSGNVISHKSARANSEGWSETADYEYNYLNKLTRQTDVLGNTNITQYDFLGRKVKEFDPNNYCTEYVYDNLNRLIEQKTPVEDIGGTVYYAVKKISYDKNNNVVKERVNTNAPGGAERYNEIEYIYDNRNRLITTKSYDGEKNNYIQNYYDLKGNLLRVYTGLSSPVTINGPDDVNTGSDSEYAVTKYSYDALGRVTETTDSLGQSETNTYDNAMGLVVSSTDRNGNCFVYGYDGLNNLKTKSLADGTNAQTHTYDLSGKIITLQNGTTKINYTYNNKGLPAAETDMSSGTVKLYTYDSNGNCTSFVLSRNAQTEINQSYTYDKLNRLISVSENGNVTASYSYDKKGNRIKTVANGEVTDYTYNIANLITSQTTGNKLSEQYTYYLNGNVRTKTSNGVLTTYEYDGMNRFTKENNTEYSFDDFGNRISMISDGCTANYTYDLNNRLTQCVETTQTETATTKYFYDYNGNRITKAVMVNKPFGDNVTGDYTVSQNSNENIALYEYNCYNQLAGVDTNGVISSYTYAPDGMRFSKTVGDDTTIFVYDNANVVEEITADGVNKYFRGLEIIKNGDNIYYLYNGQGDVSILCDGNGNIAASYVFDAYGNSNSENTVYNPFGYRGEYTDSESGLVYLRARMYDTETGTFISQDPARDGLNWYVYCEGNPINRVDSSGTNWFTDCIRTVFNVQYEMEMEKNRATDAAQKNIQREVWKLGAQKYLREQKGYLTSAWMLEHSLDDNPSDIWRGNDSRIAYLVNHDSAYLTALDKKIKSSRNGKVEGYLNTDPFATGDLYYSIHKSSIYVSGYKQKNGKWIVHTTLTDTYDFTEIQTFMNDNGGWSKQATLGTVANDTAAISQFLNAINPYEVTVDFYTTR